MFSSRTLFRVATYVFVSAAAVSCGSAGAYPGQGVAPRNETFVTVTNQNWADIKVYAIRGGSKFRLGSVTGLSTASLRLPAAVAAGATDFRLRVELIGSSMGYTTEVLHLNRGDQMDWVVQSHLPMSHIAIR